MSTSPELHIAEEQHNKLPDSLSPEVEAHRQAAHPVHPLFLNRWSPRSFDSRPVSEESLNSILEAVRWTPSAGNRQPWRFIIATTEEERKLFHSFLRANNLQWAESAPVLVLLASYKLKDDGEPNPWHVFDSGAAWLSAAFQAHLLGLSTRAIAGFEHDKARELLNIPDDIEPQVIIALGYQGSKDNLDEEFKDKEQPNGRKPLSELIIDNSFK